MFESEIAIVILNFNGHDHLKTFLPSVTANSQGSAIYVIDNASSDNSIAFLKENFPTVRIIQNELNLGFAGGYNKGLSQIIEPHPYFVLLNSDVEVTNAWLAPMHDLLKDNPSIVAVQPKILSYTYKSKFEHAGAAGGFIDKYYFPFCRGRIFDEIEDDNSQYDTTMEVAWTSGAAMMVRSKEFFEIGGFDPDFFAHMEEIDWCLRAQSAGFKLMFCSKSTVYHLGGGTMPYAFPFKTYLNFRNNLSMLIKNHQGLLFPMLFVRMALDGLAALKFLCTGKLALFWAVFKAHMYTYKNLPKNLEKRKQIKAQKEHALVQYKGCIVWNFYIMKNTVYRRLNKRRFEL
ncbi:MAG: glycosyltransferase family 2 protein [Bacteroidetes bacterium]|nr:glycosyltransferase family 2 protein [Bacteroidota bacterium]